jgi:CrcB protein
MYGEGDSARISLRQTVASHRRERAAERTFSPAPTTVESMSRTEGSLAAVLTAVGGAVGASLRYGLAVVVPGLGATLAANVVGSAALGAFVAAGDRPSPRVRLALGTGLLSSFTTYSTFAVEAVTATPGVAVVYVVASVGLGLATAALAGALTRRGPGDDGGSSGTEGGAATGDATEPEPEKAKGGDRR